MEIPQIKDKITARAFALSCAQGRDICINGRYLDLIERAKVLEKYIIGDAKLPEVAEDLNMKVLDTWSNIESKLENI